MFSLGLKNPEKVISNRFLIGDHTPYREEDAYMSNLQLNNINTVEEQAKEENTKVNRFDEDDFGSVLADIIQDNQGLTF